MGNKIANKIVKSKLLPEASTTYIEEIIVPPEQREKMLNELNPVW